MSIPDPRDASSRDDLPFLRRRAIPVGGPRAAPATRDLLAALPTQRGGRLDQRADPAPARPALPARGRTLLDLSPATPPPPAPAPQPAARPVRTRPVARTQAGTTVLTSTAPTLTLTRLQSGIGALTMQARCAEEVGDVRLGCAYQLRSGETSTVQQAEGRACAPRRSARPVIAAHRERYDRISLDLRQCREIERLIVYGYSGRDEALRWGGALIITTFGGARIELPLDGPPSRGVRVILSLYNIRGEFVLRSEMETVGGSVRDACRAYGFDRITWLDGRTPVG